MEGDMLSTEIIKALNENKTKQITTLNHTPYDGFFIRTLRQMIHATGRGRS